MKTNLNAANYWRGPHRPHEAGFFLFKSVLICPEGGKTLTEDELKNEIKTSLRGNRRYNKGQQAGFEQHVNLQQVSF